MLIGRFPLRPFRYEGDQMSDGDLRIVSFTFRPINDRGLLRHSDAVQYWNYQFKPGPWPATAEQRRAAAKKYGLTFEEYQPYPEEMGFGDYPKMPDIGADSKDPHYPYDMPELKRNFNEPFHARAEIFGEDRYDISMKPRFPVWYQALWFFGVLTGCFTLYLYLEDFKMGRPVTCKQFPKDGPHYDFPQPGAGHH